MTDDIREEFEDAMVGKLGLPLAKRTDPQAKGMRSGQASWSASSQRRNQYARNRRPEPSLPQFKCLQD